MIKQSAYCKSSLAIRLLWTTCLGPMARGAPRGPFAHGTRGRRTECSNPRLTLAVVGARQRQPSSSAEKSNAAHAQCEDIVI